MNLLIFSLGFSAILLCRSITSWDIVSKASRWYKPAWCHAERCRELFGSTKSFRWKSTRYGTRIFLWRPRTGIGTNWLSTLRFTSNSVTHVDSCSRELSSLWFEILRVQDLIGLIHRVGIASDDCNKNRTTTIGDLWMGVLDLLNPKWVNVCWTSDTGFERGSFIALLLIISVFPKIMSEFP